MVLENLYDGPIDGPPIHDKLDMLPYDRGASFLVCRHVVIALLLGRAAE
jgi:hypothetical protein